MSNKSPLDIHHAAGRAYLGGARVSLGGALSTDRSVMQLSNPAGSGKLLYVYGIVIYTSVAQWFRYAEDPTLDSPVLAGAPKALNMAVAPVASAAEVHYDELQPAAATYWSTETRVGADAPARVQLPAPIILPPGKSLAIVGDSSAAQETGVNAYWWEAGV